MRKTFIFLILILYSNGAKISNPHVLLPYIENESVSYTFVIENSGCYKWSLSREDALVLSLCDDCCRTAKVTVVGLPVESIIVTATEIKTGQSVSSRVDIKPITSLKINSASKYIYIEENPEAFNLVASDENGNIFTTLEGIDIDWSITNMQCEDECFHFVRWRDTPYVSSDATRNLEEVGLRGASVLVSASAIGTAHLTATRNGMTARIEIESSIAIRLVPSVAIVAPYDLIRFTAVKMTAGVWLDLPIIEPESYLQVESGSARVEGGSEVRGGEAGTQADVALYSRGAVTATATLHFESPVSLKLRMRGGDIFSVDESPIVDVIMLDAKGRIMTCGAEVHIRSQSKDAPITKMVNNGTIMSLKAESIGAVLIESWIQSIAGVNFGRKVSATLKAYAIEPIALAKETIVGWCGNPVSFQISYRGGSGHKVEWRYESDGSVTFDADGNAHAIRPGHSTVTVCVGTVCDTGRVSVVAANKVSMKTPKLMQPTGKPVKINIALHTDSGFAQVCSCDSLNLDTIEGYSPEEMYTLSEDKPARGYCCVINAVWSHPGHTEMRATCRNAEPSHASITIHEAARAIWPTFAVAVPLKYSLPLYVAPLTASVLPRDDGKLSVSAAEDKFRITCLKEGEVLIDVIDRDGSKTDYFNITCVSSIDEMIISPQVKNNCNHKFYLLEKTHDQFVLTANLFWNGLPVLEDSDLFVKWTVEPAFTDATIEGTTGSSSQGEIGPSTRSFHDAQGQLDIVVKAFSVVRRVHITAVARLKADFYELDLLLSEVPLDAILLSGGSGIVEIDSPKELPVAIQGNTLTVTPKMTGEFLVSIRDTCLDNADLKILFRVQLADSVVVKEPSELVINRCIKPTVEIYGHNGNSLRSLNPQVVYEVEGTAFLREGLVCGEREGSARIRARVGHSWGPYTELKVYSELEIVPRSQSVALGARVWLYKVGGGLSTCSWHSNSPNVIIDKNNRATARHKGQAGITVRCGDYSADGVINVFQVKEISIMTNCTMLMLGGVCTAQAFAGHLNPSALRAHSAEAHWQATGVRLSRAPDLETEEGSERTTGLIIQFRGIEEGNAKIELVLVIPGVGEFSTSINIKVKKQSIVKLIESSDVLETSGTVLASRGGNLLMTGPNGQIYKADTERIGVETVVIDNLDGPNGVITILVNEPKFLTAHYDKNGVWWSVRDEYGRKLHGHSQLEPSLTVTPPQSVIIDKVNGRYTIDTETMHIDGPTIVCAHAASLHGCCAIERVEKSSRLAAGGVVCSRGGLQWAQKPGLRRMAEDLLEVVQPTKIEFESPSACGVTNHWSVYPLIVHGAPGVHCDKEQVTNLTARHSEQLSEVTTCSVPQPNIARTIVTLVNGEPRLACEVLPAFEGWIDLTVNMGNLSTTHRIIYYNSPRIDFFEGGVVKIHGSPKLLSELRATTDPTQTATIVYTGGTQATLTLQPIHCGEKWVDITGCGWSKRLFVKAEECVTLLHRISKGVVIAIVFICVIKAFVWLALKVPVNPRPSEQTKLLGNPFVTSSPIRPTSPPRTPDYDSSASFVYGANDSSFNESMSRSRRRLI